MDTPAPVAALPLTLNIDSILVQTQGTAVLSSEIVSFMLTAMSTADLKDAPVAAGTPYKFAAPAKTADERKAQFENWLLSKALGDLMRGVRTALEQAFVALQATQGPIAVQAGSSVASVLSPLEEKAARMRFGQLLSEVNKLLDEPLPFADAFESLQRARNCFEHRGGIVGAVDAPGGGVLVLKFPRVKLFYHRDGKEVEVETGHVMDDGTGANEIAVHVKFELRERRFGLGQRLEISAADFYEIAFACSQFGATLHQRVLGLGKASETASSRNSASGK